MDQYPNKRIGLISAVAFEGDLFTAGHGRFGQEKIATLTFFPWEKGDTNFVYVASGIGKTNAAHAATLMIERYSPSLIVNFGIGGGYPSSGLATGDIAVASREIYADEGVLTNRGFYTAETIGIPFAKCGRRRYFNEFPSDKSLVRRALSAARLAGKAKEGAFATVSCCTGTLKRALEIEKRFGLICENMEGAAVAHISTLYGIPFIEIRGISNIVEDRDTTKWKMKLAAGKCQSVVEALLDDLSKA